VLFAICKTLIPEKNRQKNKRRLPILATPKLTETIENTEKERLVAYEPFIKKNRKRKE